MRLFDRDGDHLAGARHGVVQVVAKLQRELVLARGQLAVEHVLAVAEMHPRRRALDDVLAGRQAVLIDADVVVRDAGTRFLQVNPSSASESRNVSLMIKRSTVSSPIYKRSMRPR